MSVDLDQIVTTAWSASAPPSFDFVLPENLEAGEPPEARGLRRDQVRLLVSYYPATCLLHAHFADLPDFLNAGDVLVINTSGTLNAAVPAQRADGTRLEVHLSTHLPGDLWVVELRRPEHESTAPFFSAQRGESFSLPEGGLLTLLLPYRPEQRSDPGGEAKVRLWISHLELPGPLLPYLDRHGSPIRYPYVHGRWSNAYYQTIYATEPGSAEMPSAGRAFTPELITRLAAKGVSIAPLLLHTGVSSLEHPEPPYEEYYRVPLETARLVNLARRSRGRVIAVGTTSVRALETVTDSSGEVHPGAGWTELIITPQRGLRAVTGLLTGFHEPNSSHLAMLAALAGYEHVRGAYQEALQGGYLWHEFGDMHLLLPED